MHPDGTLTLLVVCDDALARAALIGCFKADYRVRAAASGREGNRHAGRR